MFKQTIYSIVLLSVVLLGCDKPGNKPQNVQQMVLTGLYYADGLPISVTVKDGVISDISRSVAGGDSLEYYLGPGLIDHQVNGYLSHSFVGGDLDADALKEVTEGFWKKGITTFLPTLTTQTDEVLLKSFENLNQLLENSPFAQSIVGFHLEGPFISPEAGFRGAHNLEWIRDPNWEEFEKWYRASGNRIIEVTIAPELDGAMEFIRKCREKNIVVAIGHTAALTPDINEAIEMGATVSTHLGNGCANTIHRHHNPLWPQLADDRLTASIIVDGFHLTREEVRTFFKTKGPENTVLVSDLTRLAGMPPGRYQDFGQELVMTKEGAIMLLSENVLAGASFLITRGIENVIKFTGCTLGEAIDMATRNPARLLSLQDRGEIAVGKRADLILFEFQDGSLDIRKTLVGGEVVFEKH
jgi:N-acetylglucosamine-6-phosphate deacetylase